MRKLWAVYRMELRLLCLTWYFPLLFAGLGVMSILFARNLDTGSPQATLEGDLRIVTLGLAGLITLFVAAASASRTHRARFSVLESSLPVGPELLLGRLLAVISASGSTLLIPIGIAAAQGTFRSLFAGIPLFLAEGLITLTFLAALSWLIVDSTGARRWAYPLAGATWMLFLFGPMTLNELGIKTSLSGLLNLFRWGYVPYDELWGRLRAGPFPYLLDAFYFGGALLITGYLVRGQMLQRFRRAPAALGGALLALMAALLSVAVRYAWAWHDRPGATRTEIPLPPAIQVTDYDLTAYLHDPGRPEYQAGLVIQNVSAQPLTELELILHHNLKITALTYPYERSGNGLRVRLSEPLEPGERITLGMKYTGRVLSQWPSRWDNPPEKLFFTDPGGIRLFTAAGWYPLAGDVDSATEHLDLWVHYTTHPPTRVTLRAHAPFPIASNLPRRADGSWQADSVTWLYLMGAPRLSLDQIGKVTVVTAEADLPAIRPRALELDAGLTHVARFFPPTPVQGLTLTVVDRHIGYATSEGGAGGQIHVHAPRDMLVSPKYLGGLDLFLSSQIVGYFWLANGGKANENGMSDTANFLWALFQTQGDLPRITEMLKFWPSPLLQGYLDAYREHGEEGVARVVWRLLKEPLPEREELIPDWVKEAASGEK